MDNATHTLTRNARPADPWPLASVAPPQTLTLKAAPAPALPPLFTRRERILLALSGAVGTAAMVGGTIMLEGVLKAH